MKVRFDDFSTRAPATFSPAKMERHVRAEVARALRSDAVRAWLVRTVLVALPRLLRMFVNVRPIVDKVTEQLAKWIEPFGEAADLPETVEGEV